MFESQLTSFNFVTYLPATLKEYKSGSFVEYHVLNPLTDKLERKAFRLTALRNRCRTQMEFKVAANKVLCDINIKLANGWTPFAQEEKEDSREYFPLKDAIAAYLKDKARDMRDATMVSYTSVAGILLDWAKAQGFEDIPCYKFDGKVATKFMDGLLDRPKFNNNTYNTYLKKYRACFNWLVEHDYCTENPFNKIKVRQKEEKIRGLIPPQARDIVIKYVRESKHPNYEIVMHLVFTSLIRPSEIERIQVKEIDLLNKCIHIPANKAKTHKNRDAALSDACIDMLIPLLAQPGVKPNWYLINSNYECGSEPCYHGMFKKHWMKIRKDCGLPDEMQLYSLKDTGITEMLEAGVNIVAVKDAAGHADISTTNKYVGKNTEKMIEAVRGADVSLGTRKVEIAAHAGHKDITITKKYVTDSAELKEQVQKAKALQ